MSANTGVSDQLAMDLAKALQHSADGSANAQHRWSFGCARASPVDAELKDASCIHRAAPTDISAARMSSTSGVSSQLAGDLVQAIRGAAAESSVQSLQALLARLDLVRKDRSEVNDAAEMHRPTMSPDVSCVSVSAYSGVSDQLAFDLLKSVQSAADGPTLTHKDLVAYF